MSNDVPWYGKKRANLARKERDLIRILARAGNEDAVSRAAEDEREARVRWLSAERARIPPCDGPHAARSRAIDDHIRQCLAMSVGGKRLTEHRYAGPHRPGRLLSP